MSEISKIEAQGSPGMSTPEAGVARRRLIRAGLAAAPILAGLTSQSALATGVGSATHCKPSVWSSLKGAKGCHASLAIDHGGNTCHHHTYWAGSTHPDCGKRYHYHSSLVHVPFVGTDCTQSGKPVPNLKEVCSGKYTNTRWGSVTTGDSQKDLLAKHCAAMYLNVTVDKQCPIDEATIHSMWSSCKGGGSWSLPGGGSWTRTDCIEYFEYVCKGTKPASWTWDSKCV